MTATIYDISMNKRGSWCIKHKPYVKVQTPKTTTSVVFSSGLKRRYDNMSWSMLKNMKFKTLKNNKLSRTNPKEPKNIWVSKNQIIYVVVSGCSKHMTYEKHMF